MTALDPRHRTRQVIHLPRAGSPELNALMELAQLSGTEAVMDIAAAPHHVALAFARHVRRAVAVDTDRPALDQIQAQAAALGLGNVECVQAAPDALPFAAGEFDRVVCRMVAHRVPDLTAVIRELVRVLRPGGKLLLVDHYAPDDDLAGRFLNAVEQLRDSRHVRTWRLGELGDAMADAGLAYYVAGQFEVPCSFDEWMAEAGTPGENAAVIRGMLASAPATCQHLFRITTEPVLRFSYLRAVLVGDKAG